MLPDRIAGLDVRVEGYDLRRRERETSSGVTPATTVVPLHGGGHSVRLSEFDASPGADPGQPIFRTDHRLAVESTPRDRLTVVDPRGERMGTPTLQSRGR